MIGRLVLEHTLQTRLAGEARAVITARRQTKCRRLDVSSHRTKPLQPTAFGAGMQYDLPAGVAGGK